MKYLLLFCLLFNQVVFAQKTIKPVISDQLRTANSAEVNGRVGNKFTASYENRIMAQDIDKLIHPFTRHDEHSCWQGEFWGKWVKNQA